LRSSGQPYSGSAQGVLAIEALKRNQIKRAVLNLQIRDPLSHPFLLPAIRTARHPAGHRLQDVRDGIGKDDEEVLVESAKALRNNPGPSEHPLVTQFNDAMIAGSPQ